MYAIVREYRMTRDEALDLEFQQALLMLDHLRPRGERASEHGLQSDITDSWAASAARARAERIARGLEA